MKFVFIAIKLMKKKKKKTLGKGNEAIITFAGKTPFLVGKF